MVKIIGEIGINHNGSINLCKKLILICKKNGCDYVKIQKRNPNICVPEHQKNIIRETPWGKMTYLDYKIKLEFNEEQIIDLVDFSQENNINFFASVWDKDSVDLMSKYTKIGKIPSALINNLELCSYARDKFETLIISTGMSNEQEIEDCINSSNPDVIMHTNSTYPCPVEELNLNYIHWLKNKYANKEIGYSGHESGLITTFAAVAMGANWIERHITLDKNMWGSDQKSSIEPDELEKLVKGIREIEQATKYPIDKRIEFEGELIKKKTLRN
jgi:N-acetylneuraminate synthase